MLSICIPIYNYNISSLVVKLHEQALLLNEPAEILLIDDASAPSFNEINQPLVSLPLVRYEALKTNIGRSKIRNLLAMKARYPLLLFLDCDISIYDDDFLKNYLNAGRDGSVVCGGHTYNSDIIAHEYMLHWKSGSMRESKKASDRQKKPYHSFMTASFLIPASVMYVLPFSGEVSGYGHEDTLYGFQLMQRGISIKHIDNPVIHLGLEPTAIFLKKTQQGIINLKSIYLLTKKDPRFVDMVRLLRTYQILEEYKLARLAAYFFSLFESTMTRQLSGKNPKLWVFDAYKLGYICRSGNV